MCAPALKSDMSSSESMLICSCADDAAAGALEAVAGPKSRFGLSKKSCMACSRLLSVRRRYCAALSGSHDVMLTKLRTFSSSMVSVCLRSRVAVTALRSGRMVRGRRWGNRVLLLKLISCAEGDIKPRTVCEDDCGPHKATIGKATAQSTKRVRRWTWP